MNSDFESEWLSEFGAAANSVIPSVFKSARHINPLIVSDLRHSYRSRIQLRGRLEGDDGRIWLGYFQRGSREFVPIDDCVIAESGIRRLIQDLASSDECLARNISKFRLVVTSLFDGTVLIKILSGHELSARQEKTLKERLLSGSEGRAIIEEHSLEADGEFWTWDLDDGLSYRVDSEIFVQSHRSLNRRLRKYVVELTASIQPDRVLDCYAGNGNFSLPLAKRGIPVIAIESSKPAVAALNQSAKDADLGNLQSICAALDLERINNMLSPNSVIIVDPPRIGLGIQSEALLGTGVENLIYVSCSTKSFLSDWRKFDEFYQLCSVQAFEMYPHQREFETVAHFQKRH